MKKIRINIFIIYILFLLVILTQCVNNKESRFEKTKKEWLNKEIYLPKPGQLSSINSLDSKNNQFYSESLKSFCKMVIYVDSVNCLDCDLNLIEWKQKIKEIERRNLDVRFLFILNSDYYHSLSEIIVRDKFDYPIFIDKDKCFLDNNPSFTSKSGVFLLNNENKVFLVGNPINDEKLWKLYIDEIILIQKVK